MVITFSYDLKMLDKDLDRSEYEQLIFDQINVYENCKPLSTYYFIKTTIKANTVKLHSKLRKIAEEFEAEKIATFRFVINPCDYDDMEFRIWLNLEDIKCINGLFER